MAQRKLKLNLGLHNTLTGRVEPFEPLEPGHVRMYNCGPTVYNDAHIGNMCAYMLADLLRRTFEYAGYRVTQVVNITDVGHLTQSDDLADGRGEDKLEAASRAQRRTPWDIARTYLTRYFQDLERLNIRAAHYYPRATEFVPEMIAIVERLLAKGLAYVVPSGDVYFDVTKFPAYGRLSKNSLDDLNAGARIEVREEKRNPADFALWKRDAKHIMQWDSPWGSGFPGWHIECSAMSMRYLGESFDVHTGGEDNIFPHHECEIAQSEGATGKPFVRFWLHTRFLLVEGKKMSKSAGNFYTVEDLVRRGFTGREIRYALLSSHYRTQSNFTLEGLEAARKNLERIDNFVRKLEDDLGPEPGAGGAGGDATVRADVGFLNAAEQRFDEALGADLNLSGALAALFDLVREGNKRSLRSIEATAVLRWLREIDEVLGVIFWKPAPAAVAQPGAPSTAAGGDGAPPAECNDLLAKRQAARAAKDFKEADRLRDELLQRGYVIEDTAKGPRLKKR
jgi:cysteinyl-tRNA synthetase